MREAPPWIPKVLLAVAAILSVLVLLKGLKKTDASYEAVETRGIELKRLPSAREQRANIEEVEQVSSLDLTPKVAIREADPLPPAPPAPEPAPVVRAPDPQPEPPPQAPSEPERQPFVRPALRPRGLPTERTSNASTGAFLKAAPNAPTAPASAPASSPSEPAASPDGPRVFRDTTGKATLRD